MSNGKVFTIYNDMNDSYHDFDNEREAECYVLCLDLDKNGKALFEEEKDPEKVYCFSEASSIEEQKNNLKKLLDLRERQIARIKELLDSYD